MPAATLRLLNLLTLLAWPLLVWLALTQPRWQGLFWLLALLFGLRWLQLRRQKNAMGAVMGWLALLGALLCVSSQLLRIQHLLLWYPVAVNLAMLLVFGASLWSAMPLVERLARLREPELPLRQCAIPAASPKSGACFLSATAAWRSLPACWAICGSGRCGMAA